MSGALGVRERTRLAGCEARIERGLATFVDVGQALLEVRDGRLYRAEHGTFEGYCRERWGMSRKRAYDLTAAAEVTAAVSPNGDTPSPPNEAVARELAPLRSDPPRLREAWSEAVEEHGPEPTAAQVRDKVRDPIGDAIKRIPQVQALTEPEAERLFDDAEYRPPRAITMRRPDGSIVHKAIEFMSDADAPRYVAVLEDNIRAATRRRQEFVVWLDTVLPFFEPGGTLLGALRERRRRGRRAA